MMSLKIISKEMKEEMREGIRKAINRETKGNLKRRDRGGGDEGNESD